MYADMRLVLSVISYDSNERMIGGSSKQGGGFFWGVLFSFLYFFGGGVFFSNFVKCNAPRFCSRLKKPFFFPFSFSLFSVFFLGGGFSSFLSFLWNATQFFKRKEKNILVDPSVQIQCRRLHIDAEA